MYDSRVSELVSEAGSENRFYRRPPPFQTLPPGSGTKDEPKRSSFFTLKKKFIYHQCTPALSLPDSRNKEKTPLARKICRELKEKNTMAKESTKKHTNQTEKAPKLQNLPTQKQRAHTHRGGANRK